MSLSLDEALAALDDPQYQTLDGLQELVRQVSVRPTNAVAGAETIFYSGTVGGVPAYQLVEALGAQSGGHIITPSQTPASEFLNSDKFLRTLRALVGRTGLQEAMDGVIDADGIRTPGMWDIVSKNLADNAFGAVRTISPFAIDGSVFSQTELPALLANPNVTSINGIARTTLLAIRDFFVNNIGTVEADAAIRDITRAASIVSNVGMTVPMNNEPVNLLRLTLDGAGIGRISEVLLRGTTAIARDTVHVAGTLGAVVGVFTMIGSWYEASKQFAAGNLEEGAQIIRDWSAKFLGSLAAGTAAAEMAGTAFAPLLAMGPLGDLGWLAATTFFGIAGGIFGDEVVERLLHPVDPGQGPTWDTNMAIQLASGNDALGLAYRQALYDLDPQAAMRAPGGYGDALQLYDPQTGTGEITQKWIETRSRVLTAYAVYWRSGDTDGMLSTPGGIPFIGKVGDTIITDERLGSSKTLTVDGLDFGIVDPSYIRFGSESGDALTGGTRDDLLFGAGGADTLHGGGGNDYLEGGNGADQLYGDDGDDELVAGADDDSLTTGGGNDTLDGGAGFDTYHISAGALSTTIRDADGAGAIVIERADGSTYTLGSDAIHQLSGDPNNYADDKDNRYRLVGYDLVMQLADGRVVTVKDFGATSGGQLGIALQEPESTGNPPPAPPTSFPNYWYGTSDGDDIQSTVNNFVDGASLLVQAYEGNDRVTYDLSHQSFSSAVIDAGTGADYVRVIASEVWIDGGDGNDLLVGTGATSTGVATVHGGAGSDVILTGSYIAGGTSTIFGNTQITLDAAIAGGETDENSAAIGDLLSGSGQANDETMIGSSARDVLAGGGGRDELVAGAGNDLIFGDRFFYIQWANSSWQWPTFQWDFTTGVVPDPQGQQTFQYTVSNSVEYFAHQTSTGNLKDEATEGDDDTIYAGAGNDSVLAGEGNDLVVGGSGNDFIWGDLGNDTLLGSADDDYLDGGDEDDINGQDVLDGGDGDDQLYGAGGADTLFGGSGNDSLYGDDETEADGNDYLSGEAGNDVMTGSGGSDTLVGGDGDDKLYGDSTNTLVALQGNDSLDGGAGNDLLVGEGGSDTLLGGQGDDRLYGESANTPDQIAGDDYLDGGNGADLLVGSGGADTLLGGAGNDVLYGDGAGVADAIQKSDYLDGGDGNDVLIGGGGSDIVIGGAGTDQLDGDASDTSTSIQGNDTLNGGAGDDVLRGFGGDDVLLGDSGEDLLLGGDGNDQLFGGEGNDQLEGGAGNDTLYGGAGADNLYGGAGDDTYIFDGADVQLVGNTADGVFDSEGHNRIVFASGLDLDTLVITAGATAGSIELRQSDDATIGLVVGNAFSGGIASFTIGGTVISAAQLIGTHYADSVDLNSSNAGASAYGGVQADIIVASGDDSRISGGRGNDVLTGGTGSTAYLFERGDGLDSITDLSTYLASSGANKNTLELGAAIAVSDLTLRWDAGTSRFTLATGDGDGLQLTDFAPVDVMNGPRTIDEVKFSDGTVMSWADLVTAKGIEVVNSGTASFNGTNVNDRIFGGAANETIDAGAGDDWLDGGAGNDILSGGAGSDTYLFRRGGGGDTINNDDIAMGKVDRLQIAADITVSDIEFFKIGSSLLARLIGSSDQVLVSNYFTNAGLDEIRFNDGTVYTAANVPWQDPPGNWFNYQRGDGWKTYAISDPADSILDALRFGANIDPASVQLGSNSSGDLVIRFIDADGSVSSSDRITFSGAVTNPAAALNQIVFAANPSIAWDTNQQLARARLGTAGDDYIYGSAGDDILSSLAGNDTINAGAGNDVVDGGADFDYLYGGDGNDTLSNGERMYGENGDDTLIVGTQSISAISGGAGNDTYLVQRSRRSFTLSDVDNAAGSIDVLKLGAGMALDSLRFRRSYNDLIVNVLNPDTSLPPIQQIDNSITIANYFASGSINTVIDEIRFADDSAAVLRYSDVLPLSLIGDNTSETIAGYATNDVLRGNGGDDILNGLDGDDDLDGGPGQDALVGGAGNDVYRFGRGSGFDEITDSAGNDRIELGAGILPSDIAIYRVSQDAAADGLWLVLDNGNEQLSIKGYFAAGDASRIEQIRFADGTIWDAAAIAASTTNVAGVANTQTGTSADDTYTVDHGGDVVVEGAGGGTDTINSSVSYQLPSNVENLTLLGQLDLSGNGNALDNTIAGNSGNNRIDGGSGADTLIGGAGDDVYYVDTLFTTTWGSNYNNIQDVVIEAPNGGTDTLIAYAYSATLPENVERFILQGSPSPSSGLPNNDSLMRRFVGNALDNYIDASTAPSFYGAQVYIDGGAGADVMIGNGQSNIFVVDNGGDRIFDTEGPNGPDQVLASISYVLPEGIENLTLTGSDALSGTGNAAANVLVGNSAENTLIGGAGNDSLDGGLGADTLIGGVGDDTYVVNSTADVVIENLNEGTDQVTITGGTVGDYSFSAFTNVERVQLTDSMGASNLTGDAGNNQLIGNNWSNILVGGAGNDVISDGSTSSSYNDFDVLLGGDGNDELATFAGYDTLDGGAGDDTLIQYGEFGRSTNTTYVFGRNYGNDRISIYGSLYTWSR